MTAAGADDETHSWRRETTRPTIASSRRAAAALAAAALVLSSPSASLAKTVNVTVDPDTLTAELCDDPRAGGVPGTATYKARCMQISGVATNPTKDVVYNADVYGSVKDAANDEVLNSGRVGSIAEVPPGESAFRLQITVATSQVRFREFFTRPSVSTFDRVSFQVTDERVSILDLPAAAAAEAEGVQGARGDVEAERVAEPVRRLHRVRRFRRAEVRAKEEARDGGGGGVLRCISTIRYE
jgi:hypothetical protein